MKALMNHTIDIEREVQGAYPHACGLLEAYPEGIVRPAFDELRIEFAGTTSIGLLVSLEIGRLEREGAQARLPVHWKAANHPALFPSMHGELTLRDVGSDRTALRFVGTYKPPLGVVGALGDAIAGHRLARHAVSGFLTEIIDRLQTAVAEHDETSCTPHWHTRGVEERPGT